MRECSVGRVPQHSSILFWDSYSQHRADRVKARVNVAGMPALVRVLQMYPFGACDLCAVQTTCAGQGDDWVFMSHETDLTPKKINLFL